MSVPHSHTDRRWLICGLVAIGFWVIGTLGHQRRLDPVNSIPHWSVAEPTTDTASITGYAEGRRVIVSPGREQETYGWIARAQRAVSSGALHHDRIEWDNAPAGRADLAPSLYTLWILGTAGTIQLLSSASLPTAIEAAAGWADPVVALLFLILAGVGLWRTFSARTAGLFTLGWILLQPLASSYLPGALDPRGLAWALLTGSLLTLAGALLRPATPSLQRRGAIAGVLGSLAAALDPATGLPVLLAVSAGAAAAIATASNLRSEATLPPAGFWRAWGLAGGVGAILAASADSSLSHFNLGALITRPGIPTAALWILLGEALAQLTRLARRRPVKSGGATAAHLTSLVIVLAAGALLVWLCLEDGGKLLAQDPFASRLSPNADVAADSLAGWLASDRASPTVLAMLSLLGAGLLAMGVVFHRFHTRALPLLLPALLLIGLGSAQLRFLAPAGAALLVVAVVVMETSLRAWPSVLGLAALLPGALLARPPLDAASQRVLSQTDVEAVIERDLAAWLARRSGEPGAIVLAAPKVSASLAHHAPLRGIASLAWENEEGLRAAVRIARASSPDEAYALLQQRDVKYLVLASWDPFLEDATRPAPDQPPAPQSFIGALHRWVPLRWLRPLPYRLPRIGGFEGQSVVVLEVVDEQTEPRTLSLQAEYFLETGQIRLAEGVAPELARFPADLGARIALARIALASGEPTAINAAIGPILATLDAGADRSLAWDRRVALASILDQSGNAERSRAQLQRCLRDATPARLRTLTTGALFRLLGQARKAGLVASDSPAWRVGLDLLPPDLVNRLKETATP
jgi:hypothetical protein